LVLADSLRFQNRTHRKSANLNDGVFLLKIDEVHVGYGWRWRALKKLTFQALHVVSTHL